MTFQQLGLDELLLKAIATTGYTTPTPVQAQAIPAALEGADLLVSSHTGSGKTAAFTLPSLHRLIGRRPAPGSGPRVLVLTPTRELAQQVEKAVQTYGRGLRWLNTACLVGGASIYAQAKQLSRQVDVVVATPGRLIDHLQRRRVNLADVEVLVLDEADRMLDMGFVDDIETIVAATPATRQTLLFSATLDGVVGKLARKLTRDPQRIEIAGNDEQRGQIEQRLLYADDVGHKNRLLEALLGGEDLQQAVVFTATKRSAEEISLSLQEKGFTAAALHGDMHQAARNRTLQHLRQGRVGVLVATDVAARGIDVAGISHVINFDPPRQVEDYVHRIGRTGRAGRSGVAVTLFGPRERGLVRVIERFTGDRLAVHTIAGLEPSVRPQPARRPEGGKPRFGGGGKPGGGFSREDRRGGWSGERAPREARFGEPAPRGDGWRQDSQSRGFARPEGEARSGFGGERREFRPDGDNRRGFFGENRGFGGEGRGRPREEGRFRSERPAPRRANGGRD